MRGSDVPQTSQLRHVRQVVAAVADGATAPERVPPKARLSLRHVYYGLHTARVLGFLTRVARRWEVTAEGLALLTAGPGTGAEQAVLGAAIEGCAEVQVLAPGLLGADPPTEESLTGRIAQRTGLARATAQRRAATLLSWREQVRTEPAPQVPLDLMKVGVRVVAASRLSSRGQVTIPESVRQELRLRRGDRLEWAVEADGTVRVRCIKRGRNSFSGEPRSLG